MDRRRRTAPAPKAPAGVRPRSSFAPRYADHQRLLDAAAPPLLSIAASPGTGWKLLRNILVQPVPSESALASVSISIETTPGLAQQRRLRKVLLDAQALAALTAIDDFELFDFEADVSFTVSASPVTWMCSTASMQHGTTQVSIYARLDDLFASMVTSRSFECSWRLSKGRARHIPELGRLGANNVDVDGMGMAETPPVFKVPLLPHQCRSLSWMMMRERIGNVEICVGEHRCDKPIPCSGLDVRLELKVVEGFCLSGGVLCDVVGSGKTATVLAFICKERERVFTTSATLVLCPANVHGQWLTEVQKFCPDALKVVPVMTVDDLKVANGASLVELMGADLVVAPFEVFADSISMESNTEQLKLENICWHRIVMDEFHELCSERSAINLRSPRMRQAIRHMSAPRRWGMSGTPEAFFGSAAGLARAASYLGCDVSVRTAEAFVEQFCRQARLELHVQVHEHEVHVRQRHAERALYLRHQIESRMPRNLEWKHVQGDVAPIKRLLMSCSHFAIHSSPDELGVRADEVCQNLLRTQWNVVDAAERKLIRRLLSEWLLGFCNDVHDLLAGLSPVLGETTAEASSLLAETTDIFERLRMCRADCGTEAEHEELRKMRCEDYDSDRKQRKGWSSLAYYFCTDSEKSFVSELLDRLFEIGELANRVIQSGLGDNRARQSCCDRIQRFVDWLRREWKPIIKARRARDFFKRTWELLKGVETNVSCPVCLEDVEACNAHVLFCGHAFCIVCAPRICAPWLPLDQRRCPVCRCEISDLDTGTVQLDPEHFSGDFTDADDPRGHWSSKLRRVVETLEGIRVDDPSAKAILFSQWDSLRHQLSSALQEVGIRHLLLAGSIFERTRVLREFQSDASISLLLLSLEDSASGTNLTCASHVFFLHPMLASSQAEAASFEAQAIGRVRRLGQMRPVHVWRFVTSRTIEESLRAMILADEEVGE